MESKRYFIEFSYDGTAFHGWQKQPNAISIQELIEDGLSNLLRCKTSVVGQVGLMLGFMQDKCLPILMRV